MNVFEGYSAVTTASDAVEEATRDWNADSAQLDLLLVFCSTKQDPEKIAEAISARFPGVPLIGCTTAGEHISKQHLNGNLVMTGISSPKIRWSTAATSDVGHFDERMARELSDALLTKAGVRREDLDPSKHFCLVCIDGLSCKEEIVSSLMADALDGIPLLGGSAGDDLQFVRTHVLHDGRALTSGAVFAFAESSARFEIIKHQHYVTTPKSLVITKANVATRRVYEMDGYPALEAYARALGMPPSAVTRDVRFMNPLTFVCANKLYVRSIQRIEPDGSIVFYCGIEEGMVLAIGGHEDMEGALARDINAMQKGESAELFIAFNCILRTLEADKGQHHGNLAKIVQRLAKHVIGFDTYGEQLSGLHINQTLVGIALHDSDRKAAS